MDVEIRPFASRPTLVLLQEETINFRASNLMAGPLFLRSFSVPEASHPALNDASRAMTSSATVLVNHFKGPYKSGRFGFELGEAVKSTKSSGNLSSNSDLAGPMFIYWRVTLTIPRQMVSFA